MVTFTVDVVSKRFAPLAWITVDPFAMAVTGTRTLVAFAGMVMVAGTVATVGSLELKLMVLLTGAGGVIASVRFCVIAPVMVMFDWTKVSTPEVTCTVVLAGE